MKGGGLKKPLPLETPEPVIRRHEGRKYMASSTDSLVSRRNLLRLGAFTGVATALSPVLRLGKAYGMSCYPPDRPKTPAEALNALIAGNQQWATFAQMHPGEDALRRTCVLPPPDGNGQMPYGAIISCSDSRVPPELVFDQGIGDVFVARVAGNGATGTLAESLYYGTSVLGSLVLFVLGHSDCGAVKAAVSSFPKHDLEFVKLIFPAVKLARNIV